MASQHLLEGQSVVVFGGASGLGKAIAVASAQHGARSVVVADLREEAREGGMTAGEAVTAVNPGVRFTFATCDIRSQAEVGEVVARAEAAMPTDIVVNTAAVYWGCSLLATDIAAFDDLLAVNVRGALLVAQAAARHMLPRGRGVILNTGSGGGIRGAAGFNAYAASKGALRLLTHSLAAELGPHGIRVNQVDPAYMDTTMTRTDAPVEPGAEQALVEMIPLRRRSTVEEVAAAFMYLASPLASYVNGHCLALDGGYFTAAPTPESLRRRTEEI